MELSQITSMDALLIANHTGQITVLTNSRLFTKKFRFRLLLTIADKCKPFCTSDYLYSTEEEAREAGRYLIDSIQSIEALR